MKAKGHTGIIPYGYQRKNNAEKKHQHTELMIVESEAKIIYQIFMMYGGELCTLGGIAKRLNENKIFTKSGNKWTGSRIGQVLRNPIYVQADSDICQYYQDKGCILSDEIMKLNGKNGCWLYGKHRGRKYSEFEGCVLTAANNVGLIYSRLFLQCQERLDQNADGKRSGTGKSSWLCGVLCCRTCGQQIVPALSNGYVYLKCVGKNCSEKGIIGISANYERMMEQALFEAILPWQEIPVEMDQLYGKELRKIQTEMDSCKEQLTRLYRIIETSNKSIAKYYIERQHEIEKHEAQLSLQFSQLQEKQNTVSNKQLTDLKTDWDNLNTRQKNSILKMFVNRIDISKSSIDIFWKYSFRSAIL